MENKPTQKLILIPMFAVAEVDADLPDDQLPRWLESRIAFMNEGQVNRNLISSYDRFLILIDEELPNRTIEGDWSNSELPHSYKVPA